MSDDVQLIREEIALVEAQEELAEGLPHLHGWKFYSWARKFFESTEKENLLSAANQISKSSIQIRKMIHWATHRPIWPSLWTRRPLQFWYLYPTYQVATIEFKKKWVPEFMPRGKFIDHPDYGWKPEWKNGVIVAAHFNTEVSCYFKSYSMDVQDLQTGSCFEKGTPIVTKRGIIPIEQVFIGDYVLGFCGWNKVIKTFQREAELIERKFSDGRILVGTEEHPIYSDGKWVKLGALIAKNTCYTIPVCKFQNYLSLINKFIVDIRSIKMFVSESISRIIRGGFCMSRFGSLFTGKGFQKVFVFTMSTTDPPITGLKIYSFSPGQNIHDYTSLKNGGKRRHTSVNAETVKKCLLQGVQNFRFLGIVRQLVEELAIPRLLAALNAVKRNRFVKMRHSVSAQSSARTLGSGKVYNLTVSGDHTYFANGILTHNCDAIFLDEECPENLLAELQMRLVARGGYFHAVFTPTLGQEIWRRAFEERGKKTESFVGAFKQQVSMFDCLYYDDGTRSPWTQEGIRRAINACKSEAQIQRRIYGRFVSDEGLKYPSFERIKNIIPEKEVPKDWDIFVGVDVGSGGTDNHPSAIVFVAVSPDRKKGIVFKGWRGDDVITTAADVVHKVLMLSAGLNVTRIFYDFSSKDFHTIAHGMDMNVEPAEKSHSIGEQVINVLFRNKMLSILDTPELDPLAVELTVLKAATPKRHAKDDYTDALRYAVTKIEWDWSALTSKLPEVVEKPKDELQLRREFVSSEDEAKGGFEDEIASWNQLLQGQEDYDL